MVGSLTDCVPYPDWGRLMVGSLKSWPLYQSLLCVQEVTEQLVALHARRQALFQALARLSSQADSVDVIKDATSSTSPFPAACDVPEEDATANHGDEYQLPLSAHDQEVLPLPALAFPRRDAGFDGMQAMPARTQSAPLSLALPAFRSLAIPAPHSLGLSTSIAAIPAIVALPGHAVNSNDSASSELRPDPPVRLSPLVAESTSRSMPDDQQPSASTSTAPHGHDGGSSPSPSHRDVAMADGSEDRSVEEVGGRSRKRRPSTPDAVYLPPSKTLVLHA